MSTILPNTNKPSQINQSTLSKLQLSAQPLSFQKLHSKLTPELLFNVIADLPWSIWLDSCFEPKRLNKHVDSNYDILVFQPQTTLTTHGEITTIEVIEHLFEKQSSSYTSVKKDTYTSSDDPLTLVKNNQLNTFNDMIENKSELSNLPFQGGAVGYFAYDLGRRFEKLPTEAEHDIYLPEMAVGIYHQAIIFDHKKETCTLVCLESERKNIEQWLEQKITAVNNKKSSAFSLQSEWQSNMSKNTYADKFQQVQNYLLSGDCYQINLAQRFTAKYQGDEFRAYLALRTENTAPFSAFMRFENSSILSVSPERFVQIKQNKVQSKPIKGTRPRDENKEIDQVNAQALKASMKDQAENVMIVDLLRNDISKVCQPSTVKVPALFEIESFPAVHHLVSTVEGTLSDEFDGTDLLRAAFPGGSITGAPKIRAMEIIESLEPHRRSVYCGSIGYLSNCGNMDSSITIRTLVCEKNNIHCWAGGGLVADSEVASEYQETYDKVNKIIPILNKLNE